MTKEIQLTQGQVAIVDDEDFEELNKFKWHLFNSWNGWKCAKSGGMYMHREIMKTPKNLYVDHINHDTLDNRKANLRNVSNSQNIMNSLLSLRNKTGYKGVTIHRNKYRADININNKTIYLGVFMTAEDAAKAYDKAAKEYFGEFANLNFKGS